MDVHHLLHRFEEENKKHIKMFMRSLPSIKTIIWEMEVRGTHRVTNISLKCFKIAENNRMWPEKVLQHSFIIYVDIIFVAFDEKPDTMSCLHSKGCANFCILLHMHDNQCYDTSKKVYSTDVRALHLRCQHSVAVSWKIQTNGQKTDQPLRHTMTIINSGTI